MSSNEIAIKVENLSKCYQIYDNPHDRLKQFVAPRLQRLIWQSPKQYFREFWALKDVSFEVKKGEAFGIIGRNGSGKSTLLQMICGTLTPTSGNIQTNGRIAALLELGSGFNPDFTGRENVYLNGSILGLAEEQIDARLDDILGFADIGNFIDQPLKTYSSGMFVRLAFAVQVNVDPEILIVDEALSVGDFFFQQKCFARLRKMREDGLTLLFVSHDMGTVRDLCPNSIYLLKGKVAFVGDSQVAIRTYLSEDTSLAPVDPQHLSMESIQLEEASTVPEILLEDAMQFALWRRDTASLTNDHRLLAVVVRDTKGMPVTSVRMGGKLIFQVYFRTLLDDNGHISLIIKNNYDQIVSSTGSYPLGWKPLSTQGNSYGVIEFEIDCMLESGLYSIMVSFGLPIALNQGELLDQTGWLGPLQINWNFELDRAPFMGMFGLPVRAHIAFQKN
jgi:lipopolysaccharide transport system ATP-binding protein